MAAITAFNIEQFAYMVKKMAGLREGDGTLLDNCIMMWGSGLENGDSTPEKTCPSSWLVAEAVRSTRDASYRT